MTPVKEVMTGIYWLWQTDGYKRRRGAQNPRGWKQRADSSYSKSGICAVWRRRVWEKHDKNRSERSEKQHTRADKNIVKLEARRSFAPPRKKKTETSNSVTRVLLLLALKSSTATSSCACRESQLQLLWQKLQPKWVQLLMPDVWHEEHKQRPRWISGEIWGIKAKPRWVEWLRLIYYDSCWGKIQREK